MHRKQPITLLVYNQLFPNPRPEDPANFSAHLSKNLVGEVRIETATFYGSLDTIEARYPGLNYSHPPHRKRLGRFAHHARLFRAFDDLGLTEHEIQGFCRWEGTLWARERYERDEGVKVHDTTGMEIGEWVDKRARQGGSKGINVKTRIEVEIEEVRQPQQNGVTNASSGMDVDEAADADMADREDEESDEDEVADSVGFALNERLRHAAALREQGVSAVMDPEWEQFLKEQERGEGGEMEIQPSSTSAAPTVSRPPVPSMGTATSA
ncbi:hypothetical protein BU16DRAFT_61473 [Lophium mytilinum]|uniref:Uncharacterized protein n=1 Tax=Lophium mytilinum TaxID=390894 RepID=A0A6A6QPC9_9PEZI|nr:hypothetical protein BU16DRAFT_61473 [Lophium mytilinum]